MNLLSAPPAPYHVMYIHRFQSMVDNKLIWLFVWAVVIDIFTGLIKSLVVHKTTSRKGTDGLIRHGALLLIILTLYPMLDANGFGSAGNAMVAFYITFYAVSIVENLGQMGVPLPADIKKYIYKLSDEYQKEEQKHEHKDN